ncbi:MAG: putative tail protein [Rhodocyclales bacterium]|nr:putative tail protein [Rhodocyclales bacterium]
MSHADLLALLLPPQSVDPTKPHLAAQLKAEGNSLDAALAMLDQLLSEVDPRNALNLLPDYEAAAGLPDSCGSAVPTTLADRRNALVAKLFHEGSQSRAFYISLAAQLGYTVTIDEFKPFICGISRCGDRLNGGHDVRFVWRVNVPSARATLFRCGASRCGDRLGAYARAEDLECKLEELKPAHTTVYVLYTGV